MNHKKHVVKNEAQSKEDLVRVLHLLSFLESSLPYHNVKGRLNIGKDLLQLFETIMTGKYLQLPQNVVMIASSTLAALLQIFDDTNREHVNLSEKGNVEEDSFCVKAWSSLLEANATLISTTQNVDASSDECRIIYTRSLVTITLRVLNSQGEKSDKHSVMMNLVNKLLPLTFKSIVNCMGDEELSSTSAQGICAEVGRIIRASGLEEILSNPEKNQCTEASINAMQNILQYRFHCHWDSLLPLLASFIVSIIQGIIPFSGTNAEAIKQIKSLLEPIVGSLVQLHTDANSPTAKKAVENAIGTIVQGIGLEIFLGLVDLTNGSTTIISNDRAWILSISKDALINQTSSFRPRLAFFQTEILNMARKCDATLSGTNFTTAEVSIQKSRVVDLWSLFPSFCYNPVDIGDAFPVLAKTLVRAMADVRYPQLKVR